MFEPHDGTEARRLCRIYLRLFEAGPAGANVEPADALGPADLLHRRGTDDAILVRRLLDDGLLDRVDTHDSKRYALPSNMQETMKRVHGRLSLAERLRALLARADDGEENLDQAFGAFETVIRTGPW